MPRAVRAERCRACGTPVAIDRATRQAGWFRCPACRTPAALPGNRFEVFDGPESRATVLRGRGRQVFVLPHGTLVSGFEAAVALFLFWCTACLFVGATQAAESSAGRGFGAAAVVAVALLATSAVRRAHRTEQRIEVSPRRLRLTRSIGRRGRRVREIAFGSAGLCAEGVHPPGSERFHIVVTPPQGAPLRIRCRSEREGRWLLDLLEEAAAKEDASRLHCPGCAAPVGVSIVEHAQGFANCRHCGTGFSVGGDALTLGPVRLPLPPPDPGAAFSRVRATARDGTWEWVVRPGFAAGRVVIALAAGYGAALAGAAAGFSAFLFLTAQAERPLQTVFLVPCTLVLGVVCGMLALVALHALRGRMRVRVDPLCVRVESVLVLPGFGTCRTPRPLQALARFNARAASGPPSGNGDLQHARARALARAERVRTGLTGPYRIPLNQTLPLFLVTEVAFGVASDGCAALTVRTPARALRAWWSLPGPDDARLRRELLERFEHGLRALGRDVARA